MTLIGLAAAMLVVHFARNVLTLSGSTVSGSASSERKRLPKWMHPLSTWYNVLCHKGGELHKFTPKQLELIKLIDQGLTYDEMAKRLGVSVRTVKSNTDRIRWLLGVEKKRLIPKVARDLGLLK